MFLLLAFQIDFNYIKRNRDGCHLVLDYNCKMIILLYQTVYRRVNKRTSSDHLTIWWGLQKINFRNSTLPNQTWILLKEVVQHFWIIVVLIMWWTWTILYEHVEVVYKEVFVSNTKGWGTPASTFCERTSVKTSSFDNNKDTNRDILSSTCNSNTTTNNALGGTSYQWNSFVS